MKKLFIILSFFVSIISYSQKVNPKDFYGITYSALTFGSTTSWDYQTGSHKTLTLTGNSTLSITNAFSGASGVLIVTQDGTGNRTLAVPNGTVVLNSGASESTTIAFSYDGSTFHWAGGKNKRALDTLYQDGDTLRYTINGTAYAIYNKATGGAIANGNYGNVQLNRNSALSGSDSLTVDSSTFKTKNTFQQGNNVNNIKILTREIPATAGGGSISYANTGGSGDRTASITITFTSGLVLGGAGSYLVNGNTSENVTYFANGGTVSGTFLRFDFGVGASYIIDEAKFHQSTTSTHGVWKWQGSNDASSWTDIGSTFTLGGFTPFQTITTLSGNTTGYRYYQILGVSGTTSSTPFVREFEFKIGTTGGGGSSDSTHAKIYTNTTGISIGDTLTKKVSVGDHIFDSTFRVSGSTNLNGRLRVGTVDSSASPINMATFDANGNLKKAAVPSGSGSPSLTQYQIGFGNASNLLSGSANLLFDANGNIRHNGVSDLGSGYGFQSTRGFYFRKDAFDFFGYDPSASNAEIKLSSTTGVFDVTKPMQGNYGFRVKNSTGGSIDFGGATGTGFAPYIIMRPDRTSQNHGLITVIADDAGLNPAMMFTVGTSSATALSTKDLFAFYNNTDTVAKAKADGTWLFYHPIKYKANYGGSYDARTLVDKNYVDSIVATVSGGSNGIDDVLAQQQHLTTDRRVDIDGNTLTTSANNGSDSIVMDHSAGLWIAQWNKFTGGQVNAFQLSNQAVLMQSVDVHSSPSRGGRFTIDGFNAADGATYTDFDGTNPTGIKYNGDYSATFTDRSLVDKGYVNKISAKTLDVQYTDVSNSGTSETDLMSYTIPANTLVNNGDRIVVEANFTTASNADAKDLKFYFAGNNVEFTTSTIPLGTSIDVKFTIIKTGSTTARVVYSFLRSGNPIVGNSDLTSLTFSGTIITKFTFTCDASSDGTQKSMTTTFYPR